MKYVKDSNSLERYRIGKKPKEKKNKFLIVYVVIGLIILLVAGALYENMESRKYLNLGKESNILINRTDYNYKIESTGKYTVIVDGVIGETFLNRQAFMKNFDNDARVFFYDRPPYDNTEGEEKTPKEIAEDLHFMFRKFGFENKYIVIGEEYGSLVMEEFINLYPDEVIGAIFINPVGQALSSQDINEYFSVKNEGTFSNKTLGIFGIPRLLNNTKVLDYFDTYTFEEEETKKIYSNIHLSKDHIEAMEKETEDLNTFKKTSINEFLLEDNPVYLITSEEKEDRFNQDAYLKYSTDSEVVYVRNSINDVILSSSYEVNAALNRLIRKVFILEKTKGN